MANIAKSNTNPLVVDATGYMPYALKRAELAAKNDAKESKTAARQATEIRNYWVKEQNLQGMENYLHQHEHDLFRSQWECQADKRGLHSRVKWEMDKVNRVLQSNLEERRIKLKEMLCKEQQAYFGEREPQQITPSEKETLMQQRYKDIILQKELKRQGLVKVKKDQQFRMNCDELRSITSKRIAETVAAEGQALVEQRNKHMKEKELEDQMYADAWIKDCEAKAQNQQEEQRRREERNSEYGEYIKSQISGHRVPKYDIPAMEHEKQMNEEQTRLMEIEKEWEYMRKKLMQDRTKKDLDVCLQDKLLRKSQEVQQDLILDLHYLEQLSQADVEKQKAVKKKESLKVEQQQYLAYLAEQVKREAEYEKSIEKRFQEENDKMWKKKEAQWEREKKMRQTLNKKIIQDLSQQIRDKAESMKIEFDENLAKQAIIDQEAVMEEAKEIRRKNVQNQEKLLEQIREKEKAVQETIQEKKKELEQLKKERDLFDRKIQEVIADCKLDNVHPYRMKPDPCCCTKSIRQ